MANNTDRSVGIYAAAEYVPGLLVCTFLTIFVFMYTTEWLFPLARIGEPQVPDQAAAAPNGPANMQPDGMAGGEAVVDRLGNRVVVPLAVPGSGRSPMQLLNGHWLEFTAEAPVDGVQIKNGPWPTDEATHIYIDTQSGRNTHTTVFANGTIEERLIDAAKQNAKTGEVILKVWMKKDDEQYKKTGRGAAQYRHVVLPDGTFIKYEPWFGDTKVITYRRIGDENTF